MRLRVGLAAAVLFVATPSAHAQEIVITGPLAGSPPAIHYRPFELRGDVLVGATTGAAASQGHDVSRAFGVGGTFRHRSSSSFAWEVEAGLLHGVEDAGERRFLVSPRIALVAVPGDTNEWELYAAIGPSLERMTSDVARRTLVGAELGLGIDRRIDGFNRFVVELVLADRGATDETGWSRSAILRIGIATTFGYVKEE